MSLGSDAMALRSSIGAQATPTVNTVIPVTGKCLEVRINNPTSFAFSSHYVCPGKLHLRW